MAVMKTSSYMFMMAMFVVASMQMQSSMAQTRHVVGDALGWTIPSNGAAAYTAWASQQTFLVNDILVFNFTTGVHNVAEVSQSAYGPCTTTNTMSITTTGPATITLTTPGAHYYVCTVGTHCQIGQKLAINVSAAPTTPPPTTTPTPVSPPTTTPSSVPAPVPVPSTTPSPTSSPTGASPPTPTTSASSPSNRPTTSPTSDTTPPPPPSNTAARSFTVIVPATFLAVALAFFY